ncbi:MAG: DUF6340 family protein [Bacteroidales bacterium]|jgi:hypothetical protein|nr:DUF6340 family protein [Bacteroidales bacterium]MDD3101093.1 DUF6340 family protein [Bacteroidales bacterium]MDD3639651.1 DUF6340 family protein [Bacteroidales bacterium]MDD3944233.1 DUF6340 family protein [Bacteroidales bacterium]MDD4481226.1 DUF6340 family protein [Bacteroidales bacterium]
MKAIRTISLLALFCMTAACGPMINILEVDVRLPASRPINILGRNMAVFTPQYDSVSLTDSVLMHQFAQALADGLATQARLREGSIPLYRHYSGNEPLGTLEHTDYVHRLGLETEADMVFMVDSIRLGAFGTDKVAQVQDDYKLQYLYVPFYGVIRVYDMDQARFTDYIPLRDTAAWEVWIPYDQENLVIPRTAFEDLQKAARFFGNETAQSFVDQWETQDRILFVYNKRDWNRAYDHALVFEWEKAMDIWLTLLDATNVKEVACAAFNVAVACEMQGLFDLARKWLDFSQKTLDMPETKYYADLLQERNKQKKLF